MRRSCNHLILFSLIFRPAALCWWAPKIIVIIIINDDVYGAVIVTMVTARV